MESELRHEVDDWAQAMLATVEPKARRELAGKIGLALRRSHQERIRAQKNPDGSNYEPRKPQALREKKGAIKRRAMFQKLSTARFLKIKHTPEGVTLGFYGRVARIARVHQEGGQDRVNPQGIMASYPARRLLGFSRADRQLITDHLLDHLKA